MDVRKYDILYISSIDQDISEWAKRTSENKR